MDKNLIINAQQYMLTCMRRDPSHDCNHVYRVLKLAAQIACREGGADMEILILSCLLHDIGRPAQHADPACCHAQVGAEMAYNFLLAQNYPIQRAAAVRDAILTHRFRSKTPPESLEAKILFDADTLDVTGAIGIARTLQFSGKVTAPIYGTEPDGQVQYGETAERFSFLGEYEFKLKNLYDRFCTETGRQIAQTRHAAATQFHDALLSEILESHTTLDAVLETL